MGDKSVRIVLADAQPLIREGLRTALLREPGMDVIAEAADGAELLLIVQAMRPDLAILDGSLRHLAIADLVARLGEQHLAPRLLVMLDPGSEALAPVLLEAGARGLLSKSAAPIEYLNAVRAVLGGGIYLSAALFSAALYRSAPESLPGSAFGLTQREREVLALICGGFSNKDIARRLALSVRTVETHRLNIRKKTRSERLRDLVLVGRQLGLDHARLEEAEGIWRQSA